MELKEANFGLDEIDANALISLSPNDSIQLELLPRNFDSEEISHHGLLNEIIDSNSLQSNSSRRKRNPLNSTLANSNHSSRTERNKQILVIDNEKESKLQCIDLTKDNDDIIYVDNSPKTSNKIFTKQTTRRVNRVHIGNPTTSSMSNFSDAEIIQNNINETTLVSLLDSSMSCNTTSRIRRNRISRNEGHVNTNIDATIIIDDDNKQESIVSSQQSMTTFPNLNVITLNLSRNLNNEIVSPSKRSKVEISSSNQSKSNLNTIITSKKVNATNQKESGINIQCPICLESLEELKSHNKRLKSTHCGHILCGECLDATFKINSSGSCNSKTSYIYCPTCRAKITKAKIHDLFL